MDVNKDYLLVHIACIYWQYFYIDVISISILVETFL